MRGLIAAVGRLPLWVRWGVVFFVFFTVATWFRGPLAERPLQTLALCAAVGVLFGVLAQVEQKLPGGRQKRKRN